MDGTKQQDRPRRWLGALPAVTPNRLGGHVLRTAVLVPIFVGVHVAAFWLRFEGHLGSAELAVLAKSVSWVLLVKLLVFTRFRVFQGWRHLVTFHDLVLLVKAATVSALLVAAGDYLMLRTLTVPRSVFLMDWAGTIVAVAALQALIRMCHERARLPFLAPDATRVLIVGANASGETLLRAIDLNPRLPYRVVGFIAEHESRVGTQIGGVPVVGTLAQTCRLSQEFGVEEVLIITGELSGKRVRRLVEDGRRHHVAVKMLPSFEQLLTGTIAAGPRGVSIEDLLHRDPVELDLTQLRRWIEGRVLLVTGSAGSIGAEICRQLLQFRPRRLVLVDRSENGQFFLDRELRRMAPQQKIDICMADIVDHARLQTIFRRYRPEIVFHAAAYKHVPMMEANPGEAVKNIVLATRCVADLAARHGVQSFVMISTDKAVNPTSVMGACKRLAELYVQSLAGVSDCRFVTVRFGNVLDSAGSVVPVFREQIARGGPVTVTHPEMVRFFMTIPEASQLVVQAGVMGQGGEIFVLDMGEPVRILDLAADMVRLSGLRVGEDIEIEFCGFRPGEKLYEELHGEDETRTFTSHPKILVAESARRDHRAVAAQIEQLENIADRSIGDVVAALAEMLPEYRPIQKVLVAECRGREAAKQVLGAELIPAPATSDARVTTRARAA